MSKRITQKQVFQQAERLSKALERITNRPQPIQIEIGSKLNGISWKAYGEQEGHNFPTVSGFGYIGMTAKEAYDFLWAQATALESARWLLETNQTQEPAR